MSKCEICKREFSILSSGVLCLDDAQKLGFNNTFKFNRGMITVEEARRIIGGRITRKGE